MEISDRRLIFVLSIAYEYITNILFMELPFIMTDAQLLDLKKRLPRGWTKIISKMANVHPQTVWKVFNGLSTKRGVLEAGIQLIEEEQAKVAKIQKILES